MNIREVIVVEGKHDTSVLQQYFNCATIETNGTRLSKETLRYIREAKERRGVIIFTDPDHPGELIRRTINEQIPGCKNAYIEKNKAKTSRKVGVEHASKEDLQEALAHCFTYVPNPAETIGLSAFLDMGLQGRSDSAKRRAWIAKVYHLGKPNAKTLRKRLNLLRLTEEDIRQVLAKGGFA